MNCCGMKISLERHENDDLEQGIRRDTFDDARGIWDDRKPKFATVFFSTRGRVFRTVLEFSR